MNFLQCRHPNLLRISSLHIAQAGILLLHSAKPRMFNVLSEVLLPQNAQQLSGDIETFKIKEVLILQIRFMYYAYSLFSKYLDRLYIFVQIISNKIVQILRNGNIGYGNCGIDKTSHTRQQMLCYFLGVFPVASRICLTLVLFKLLPVKLLLVTDIQPRLSRHLQLSPRPPQQQQPALFGT